MNTNENRIESKRVIQLEFSRWVRVRFISAMKSVRGCSDAHRQGVLGCSESLADLISANVARSSARPPEKSDLFSGSESIRVANLWEEYPENGSQATVILIRGHFRHSRHGLFFVRQTNCENPLAVDKSERERKEAEKGETRLSVTSGEVTDSRWRADSEPCRLTSALNVTAECVRQ
jgi:hypothetical protein